MGLTESIRARADRLAHDGFAAFACDVFGAGVLHQPAETAREVVAPLVKDPAALRARLRAGIGQLKRKPEIDASRIGGIGFGFGGFGVLALVGDGEPIQAAVTLHAEVKTITPMRKGGVSSRLLILHGDCDPVAPRDDLTHFLDELRGADAHWELGPFSGARHSFTGEGAWGDVLPEAKLDSYADARSWAATIDFLRKVLSVR